MFAIKIYQRQDINRLYVLQCQRHVNTMTYAGGEVPDSVATALRLIPSAAYEAAQLHGSMRKQRVWSFALEHHSLVMAAFPPDCKLEIVPDTVLTILQESKFCAVDDLSQRLGPLYEILMPFQREGVQKVVEHGGRFMIADEMGLGKTMQGLGFLQYYRQEFPAIVICPAAVKSSWAHHIKTYMKDEVCVIHTWTDDLSLSMINIMSYGMFSSRSFENKRKAFKPLRMVVDESHYVKHSKSARTKKTFEWTKTAQRVLLLTGTPLNRTVELYAQLKCVDRTLFSSFFHYRYHAGMTGITMRNDGHVPFFFATRYCRPDTMFKGGRRNFVFKGSENEAELHAIVKTRAMVRRTKLQVLPELPLKIREKVVIDQWVQEKPLEFKSEAHFMEFVRDTAARKVKHVEAYLHDIILPAMENDPRLKLLLWGHHHIMLDALETAMTSCTSFRTVRMDGSTSMSKRTQMVHAFQNDPETRVAVMGITAMGTGVTMTAATLSIKTELCFTPDIHLQAEDRCHRIGQTLPVCIRYLCCEGSTDDIIWYGLIHKVKHAAMAVDGMETRLHCTVTRTSEMMELLQQEAILEESGANHTEEESTPTEEESTPTKGRKRKVASEATVVDFDTLDSSLFQ